MCGRFAQTQSGAAIASHFQLETGPDVLPRYNIAPTQPVSVITQSRKTQKRYCHDKTWGLVPRWAKIIDSSKRLINARAETVASKPTFKDAFQRRRCLIVADSFYEWQQPAASKAAPAAPGATPQKAVKQPFLIQLKTKALFAFAGLWEYREVPNQQPHFSCTILTTSPNALMASIHHRMPVILPAEEYDLWLDPSTRDLDALQNLLRPYPDREMTAIPIGTAVNNPKNDRPEVQEPCLTQEI